ncbi:MAG: NAD-dependent epimerase/dehydratase family protein [Luteolibacter sp.]
MSSSPPPLRIMIIGGSGFVSGTLARMAVARGHEVTVITRGQRPAPSGVEVVTVDRNDRQEFANRIASLRTDWDLVVDAIPYTPDDARQDVEAFAGRTGRLVFISTDFVYDPKERKIPQSEHDAVFTTDGYGGQKRLAEIVLEETARETLPWTILRPSHIYGPGSLPGCLPLHGRDPVLVESIRQGLPLQLVGGGRFLQHPIFAPDLAEVILSAAGQTTADGTFNVAGPDVLESRAYYQVLGRLLGREVMIEEVPVAGFLEEHPEKAPFCCDRSYDLSALKGSRLYLPATSLENGLRIQQGITG